MSRQPDFASLGGLAACFLVSMVVSWLALRYGHWRQLIDQPGERRSHATPTPRGGGVGIVAGLLVALVLLGIWHPERRLFLAWSGVGLSIVAGIGWIDDHRPLSPWWRLAVQGVASWMLGYAVLATTGHWPAAVVVSMAALVLVNVWNFMDGIDGLATMQAIVVAASGALLATTGSTRWLGFALVVACLGFLPFNFPRARVFLGDVGSGAIGYALAVVSGALLADTAGAWLPALLLLLPASAFFLDASLTLASRMLRGERWWTPHVGHVYQRWAGHLRRHAPVTWALTAWSAAGSLLMVSIDEYSLRFIFAAVAAWYFLGLMSWFALGRLFRTSRPRK